jgi:hypothetical protein
MHLNSSIFNFEMSGFAKRCLMFSVPIMLMMVIVFLQPLDKQFAYNFVEGECSGHGKWIHDRLFENETPIDIAFVGTSVGWGLCDDQSLSKMLSEKKGKTINVVNLSYCRPGLNMRALMIEEIIRTKHPKHIVLELGWKPSRGGHHLYGYLATTHMLLAPATYLYQAFPSDAKTALIVRWEKIRDLFYPETAYVKDSSPFGFAADDVLVDQGKMRELLERRTASSDQTNPETLQESIHYFVYWKNMEYIKKLCDDNGIRLSFFYVNRFGNELNQPKYLEQLKKLAPIWYAPDSIFQDPQNYADPVHLNRSGSDAITPVMFDYLQKYDY